MIKGVIMIKEKEYISPVITVLSLNALDVIRTSLPSGEDGNDIFDDR